MVIAITVKQIEIPSDRDGLNDNIWGNVCQIVPKHNVSVVNKQMNSVIHRLMYAQNVARKNFVIL